MYLLYKILYHNKQTLKAFASYEKKSSRKIHMMKRQDMNSLAKLHLLALSSFDQTYFSNKFLIIIIDFH